MKIWDRNTIYTMWNFFNSNRVKDTQRLYQNGLILQLVRKKDFHVKIMCIYFK